MQVLPVRTVGREEEDSRPLRIVYLTREVVSCAFEAEDRSRNIVAQR